MMDQQSEWEQHLPLVLFAYRLATHPSTGFSPFELMFGRQATLADFPQQSSFEPMSHQAELCNWLSEFCDLVDTHHTQAGHHQKLNYDRCTQSRTFAEGDPVWLSCPTIKKLDARWEGGWQSTKVITFTTIEIKSTKGTKIVHSNRLWHPHVEHVRLLLYGFSGCKIYLHLLFYFFLQKCAIV